MMRKENKTKRSTRIRMLMVIRWRRQGGREGKIEKKINKTNLVKENSKWKLGGKQKEDNEWRIRGDEAQE